MPLQSWVRIDLRGVHDGCGVRMVDVDVSTIGQNVGVSTIAQNVGAPTITLADSK